MTAVISPEIEAVPSARSNDIVLRRARVDDGAALLQMFERCSVQTRYGRWHGHTYRFPSSYLAAVLSESDDHLAMVAAHEGQLIALASAPVEPPGSSFCREVAILVEDAFQRHGVGRALLDRTIDEARALGTTRIRAEILHEDAWLLRWLRRHGTATIRISHGVVIATVELEPRAGQPG